MRLRYERLSTAHARPLFEAMCDPGVFRYIDEQPPDSVEDLAERFERMSAGPPAHRARETWWNHAVQRVDSGEFIGRLEATIVDGRAEIAYVFGVASWGQGFGGEAVRWLIDRLEAETAIATLWATARPENARSINLLHRIGFRPAGEWPALTSYDPGDAVYRRPAGAAAARQA